MNIQILNSFRGDSIKDVDTSTPDGRKTAGQLITELMRTGSALFLEKEVNGQTYTYRVAGYDEERDKIKLVLSPNEVAPADFEVLPTKRKSGPRKGMKYNTRSRQRLEALASSNAGRVVSVAPVSGGAPDAAEAEMPSWDQVRSAVDTLCEQRGWHHGCPMPSTTWDSKRLMLARGAPGWKPGSESVQFGSSIHIDTVDSIDEDPVTFVNEWTPTPRKIRICRDSKGVFRTQAPTSAFRLHMMLDSYICRTGAVDSNTELVAMVALQKKISASQWDSYLLNGAFPETSPRSGVTYILRKGLPTIAMTEKPLPDGRAQRKFLCALCAHPLAYYQDTFVGSQCPTDEVIGHLLMIRADEHFLWRKANQHPIDAPEAAI